MSLRDKWVRRFSIDETSKHKNGFTIYKITSVLFPLESPEAVTVVSVWKRYSDIQQLHKSMKSLHAGLHLKGIFPSLAKSSYFKRFQQEVIEERAKTIKELLEFIAEHRLLFTSTDFVNFLQEGYPEPDSKTGVINAIRSSLHLPLEDTPPLEYQSDEDTPYVQSAQEAPTESDPNRSNFDVSQIPIYEATEVEIREMPKELTQSDRTSGSFESINSLESLDSDLYDELSRVAVKPAGPSVKKKLPDLIDFKRPSTSERRRSCADTSYDEVDGAATGAAGGAVGSAGDGAAAGDYVFEAGYLLSVAARCEDAEDYRRAFECYKSGIEKLLLGVQTDPDFQRRALVKQKTNKYLSYAEQIYKQHLRDVEQELLPAPAPLAAHAALPLSMLARPAEHLASYRVLGALGDRLMLVVDQEHHKYYAMKVIQKIPRNLTEFDSYFRVAGDARAPVLPTVVPYMVPLHAYVQTDDLIFLILAYAPGEKLTDYIRNYVSSHPATPARRVNLENVFPTKRSDDQNNIDVTVDQTIGVDASTDPNENVMSPRDEVSELVLNSQRLLLNVDKVLSDVRAVDENIQADIDESDDQKLEVTKELQGSSINIQVRPRDVLPPLALQRWGAQLLTALQGLHNCGVRCRDLNPNNILLGSQGQVILTYFLSYPEPEVSRAQLWRRWGGRSVYVAPELYDAAETDARVADYWSFGAVMYELLCGEPLRPCDVWWSHSRVPLPPGLPLEERELLTQLLTPSPLERLGAGGPEEIQRHPYFRGVHWPSLRDHWSLPD